MNKELIVILNTLSETDHTLCSRINRNDYSKCKGIICSNCCVTPYSNKDYYTKLITSLPL